MDSETLLQIRDLLAVLAVMLRWTVNLGVTFAGYVLARGLL